MMKPIEGAELQKQADLLDKFQARLMQAAWWELSIVSMAASGIGFTQSILAPLLAWVDVGLGPIDEMVIGGPPMIITLEVIRRMTGRDGLMWLRDKIGGLSKGTLFALMAAMTALVTVMDGSIYIPIIGIVSWIGGGATLLIGLPAFLVAFELTKRKGN